MILSFFKAIRLPFMKKSTILTLLKFSVCCIFIGRAWQHLFWDAPYRSFFWDEGLLQPIVESLTSMTWQEYATSPKTDAFIQGWIRINGFIYLLAAIATFTIKKTIKTYQRIPILIGGIGLIVLNILMTKEKFYHLAQFFEHSIQFGLPFFMLWFFKNQNNSSKAKLILKVLIALTFFSHGLYAFGAYPVPGKFVDMVIQIFGCSEELAITFLYIAGILDFIVAVLIFVPKIEVYALWYAFAWGILTALARIVANFYIDFPLQSIHQNLYQVIYRLPHGLVPLLVLLFLGKVDFIKRK